MEPSENDRAPDLLNPDLAAPDLAAPDLTATDLTATDLTATDLAAPELAAPELAATDMELYDLRVVVERIEGRSVCGLAVGDFFEVTRSSQVRIPTGGHFCLYALAAVLPLLPAKQRPLPAGDWLERDSLVACPDPDERLVMRIERLGLSPLNSRELT